MALVIPLLTLNKEMLVGISAFTLKQLPLSKAIIWFQPCIFVFLSRQQQKHTDGTPEKNRGSDHTKKR